METQFSSGRVCFGEFEVNLRSGELHKRGIKIKLHGQCFQALKILLEQPGEVVSREELRQRIWPTDTFVNFDVGLNSAVKKLRDALGDSAETPRFIETLPRRGYRFIAAVDLPAAESAQPTAAGAERLPPQEEATDVAPGALSSARLRGVLIAVVTATIGLAVVVAFNIGGVRSRLLGKPGTARVESIAVLPLVNLSSDAEQEYFAAGVTEALITDLGKISALRVISHTSVMQYRDTKKSLPEIARELKVDALVEGTVARSGNRVRITANLVQASPEKHLWADSYERNLGDILMLQDEVARAIATGIQIKLTPQEQARLASARPVNPEAYEAYVKGRYFMDMSWKHGGFEKAGEYFQQAIEKDPTWALPYSGLADFYLFTGINDVIPNEYCPMKAKAAALEALKRDDASAEAYTSVAEIEFWCNWNWRDSERAATRAIELNPSLAEARRVHGHWLLAMGRTNEGLAEMKRAVELDPLSLSTRWSLGYLLYLAGRYDQSAAEFRQILELDPSRDLPHIYLGAIAVQKGDLTEAIRELETAVNLGDGGNPRAVAYLGYAYALAGRRTDAQNQLDKLKEGSKLPMGYASLALVDGYVSPALVAGIYTGLGRNDEAFAWLEKAYQVHSRDLLYLRYDPQFVSLHSDPRFSDLVVRVGLPP
jgi:TolB-like protein/DNA-binding winged helix-turn-helix (wHTH) protein/Tfp pilus assembly protein PilF